MKDFLEVIDEAQREGVLLREAAKNVSGFNKKLVAFVKLLTNESGMSSHRREYLMKEAASTSDFPLLFGTVLERTLLGKYSIATPDWRNYVKTGTQNDFRPADAYGVYGLQGGLSEVKQRGEYRSDAKLGEGRIQISLKKYGRSFGIGWETLINDDLGAFSDIADRLSTAALRTEFREATKLIAQSTGPNTALYAASPGITHPIDKAKVINKLALALTADNLGSAISTLKNQKDADGEPIAITAVHLVVPPALEYTMLQVLSAGALIVSGGDATSGVAPTVRTSVNVTAQMGIVGHMNPYLPIIDTSAGNDKTWYLFAQLADGYAAKLNFLRGHESPELVMKAPNKVTLAGGSTNPFDGNFEEDTVFWRVRHVLGGTQFDPRMTVASVAP